MHAIRWLALGAAAAALMGATAISPRMARAADPAVCRDGPWMVCRRVVTCFAYEDDVCLDSDEVFAYYEIEPT
jgi:hypothetical protein